MTRLAWGKGKLEVWAVKPDILDEIERGQTKTTIFKDLKDAGKITLKYSAFCHHIAAFQKNSSSLALHKTAKHSTKPLNRKFNHDPQASDRGMWKKEVPT